MSTLNDMYGGTYSNRIEKPELAVIIHTIRTRLCYLGNSIDLLKKKFTQEELEQLDTNLIVLDNQINHLFDKLWKETKNENITG